MNATLNSLNLKKGDTIFLYGNWNGNENATIDFYIQKYIIYSIGKKRCYLLYNAEDTTRKEYNCTNELNIALTLEAAKIDCIEYIPGYISRESKGYLWRIENWGKNNKQYCALIEKMYTNITTASVRVLINPFKNDTPEIINL